MDKRAQLFLILSLVIFLASKMYLDKKYPQKPRSNRPVPTATAPAANGIAFQPTTSTLAAAPPAPEAVPEGPKITVDTDVYHVVFATNGASPVAWEITGPTRLITRRGDSPTSRTTPRPEDLIPAELDTYKELPRPFQVVLKELNSRYFNEFNYLLYAHEQLDEGGLPSATGLTHRFTSAPNASGLSLVKTYIFAKDSFLVGLNLRLINGGASNISFGDEDRGLGVILGPGLGEESASHGDAVARYGTVDAVLQSTGSFLYEQFKSVAGAPEGTTPGATITFEETRAIPGIQWGGIVSKYFLTALIPSDSYPVASAKAAIDNRIVGKLTQDRALTTRYPLIELYGAPFALAAGEQKDFSYTAYIGPVQRDMLYGAGHNLERALFHDHWDIIRSLARVLLALLFWIHGMTGNWGMAIILLTVLVRLATLPIVHRTLKSQAKMTKEMNKIKPLVEKINAKYADDPQRKQTEIFKLYKEHNINPLGMLKGCGWVFVQMPIFIGLYVVFYKVIDLRGAPFLWIEDLSQPENLFSWGVNVPVFGQFFNILPFVVALTQMASSKFMQTPSTDPQQQQMQQMMVWMMPLMILSFTYRFPAGLMLYWLVSNLWQVVQQIYANKVIHKPQAAAS